MSRFKDIKEFTKEKNVFFILNRMNDSNLIITDNSNYIIGRDKVGLPVWIWTKNKISKDKVKEIEKHINEIMKEEKRITCKSELFDILKTHYATSKVQLSSFLECDEIKKVKKSSGFLDKANYSDKIQLAKFWKDFCEEMYNYKISMEYALEDANEWLIEDNFFVYRTRDGKAVSMASISLNDDLVKISHVYTPKLERKKGYCQNLIHDLSLKIIDNGYKPVLYVDKNCTISNKVYSKIGFKEKGMLVNFEIEKKK